MRVAKIVAIANQKGGVGKTTTAVNLSSCVAALGKKVLIVDLDPQGNTTTGYGIPKRSVECGTYEVLIGKATAAQAIRKTEFRTDVIGSNTRLAGASLEMIDLPFDGDALCGGETSPLDRGRLHEEMWNNASRELAVFIPEKV